MYLFFLTSSVSSGGSQDLRKLWEPPQRKERERWGWGERQDCSFWQYRAVSLTQPCCENSPLGNNVHTTGWLTVLQIVARRELPDLRSLFCRVALFVFGVLCFETDTYPILIMLLHENVLQKYSMCRADLSGNLMLSKWVRSHRTWKNLYFSLWDNLPIGFWGIQKPLYFWSAEPCRLESLGQRVVLHLWTSESFC